MISFLRRHRVRRLSEQVHLAQRNGIGVYLHEWAEADRPVSTADVLAWCRETLGMTRRPWGVAHFDLALALNGGDGGPARTLSLRRLAPADLYPGDSLLGELTRFLEVSRHAEHHPGRLAVALFSWGDATHAVLAS